MMLNQNKSKTLFNPAVAAEKIKQEYIGYISTTFHFKDKVLRENLDTQLQRTVSNGPFVEIKDIFKKGKSLSELMNEGIVSSLFSEVETRKPTHYRRKIPVDRPLYAHQEKAVRMIGNGRNVVVSTGTGSGKTDCFLIPIINELLHEKENGTLQNKGVRAMLIYPMNALANDQIKSIREILMYYPEITFGVYNGGTENDEEKAIALYETMYATERYKELRTPLRNEELSREGMKANPPHVLFTNYAMLEHMLLRPGDDVLFTDSDLKFVVLDEAHVYYGATGIETRMLMNRLKARIKTSKSTQFILTSATLGGEEKNSDDQVIEFAESLTGCQFTLSDIIKAERQNYVRGSTLKDYPVKMFVELADSERTVQDILKDYDIQVNTSTSDEEIFYDLIETSRLYDKLRFAGNLIEISELSKNLDLTNDATIAFIALCAKAKKNERPLIDARYHFFVRALDGCYLALDYKESLSLLRMEDYEHAYKQYVKMFEVGVCGGCGEMSIIGKEENGYLSRANISDIAEFYQIDKDYLEEDIESEDEAALLDKKNNDHYVLCKTCGAIVALDETKNKWCSCGNTKPVKLIKSKTGNCLNCNNDIRKFILGFEAATSVLATSLYEQIPEYTFKPEESLGKPTAIKNIFSTTAAQKMRRRERTGSQFLVFSDSRQGAAKFACHLDDMYKEFSRRRGIWNVVDIQNSMKRTTSMRLNEFVDLLENYFGNTNIFREDNNEGSRAKITDNRRYAWVAVLNELVRSGSNTSLVSLGKLKFEYLGNSDDIIRTVMQEYGIGEYDVIKNFLNFLAFEVVRERAISTDSPTDINSEDMEYIFYAQSQQFITKERIEKFKAIEESGKVLYYPHWMPLILVKMDGTRVYRKSNKLLKTAEVLNCSLEKAAEFLGMYFDYLSKEELGNNYKMETTDGQKYTMPARNFQVYMEGDNKTNLWICDKCGKVTQFNIGGICIQKKCGGRLSQLDSENYCKNNYYAQLYQSSRYAPLFIKEHTAQLAKNEALVYQKQFVNKSINALSCSTTFEMGVDVGDLETVFLRNIPPSPSNYAQRVGRAGRSIDAAAFALTYARLSSHDFTFFDEPKTMISGVIVPPLFNIRNEKIIRRHIYAVAISLFFRDNPDQYDRNRAERFINQKGYIEFINWLNSKPDDLKKLLKKSIPSICHDIIDIENYGWLELFCGENGIFLKHIREFESNVKYLEDQYKKAMKIGDSKIAEVFRSKQERYAKKELIDFLVRGNILPKYGFPIDAVELSQNISQKKLQTLNLNRDLSVAIAEYAPSSEVIADGRMYTSRYIKKQLVNRKEAKDFDLAYIAKCPECEQVNFSEMPVSSEGILCTACRHSISRFYFGESIQPRSGFVSEENPKPVPLKKQEKNYRTEAVYVWDKDAYPINEKEYTMGKIKIELISTGNDALVVMSTNNFYVCPKCGYSIAEDEQGKLKDYKFSKKNGIMPKFIETTSSCAHKKPFGNKCDNYNLQKYTLHHEFKTDVAKITFGCDTSDLDTMLSVMYAILNSISKVMNIERRDIRACLTCKVVDKKRENKIIIYDSVPGGAGHSRRLMMDDDVFKRVVYNAYKAMSECKCTPSCYKCLRSYENQKIHDKLDHVKAAEFLKQLID